MPCEVQELDALAVLKGDADVPLAGIHRADGDRNARDLIERPDARITDTLHCAGP